MAEFANTYAWVFNSPGGAVHVELVVPGDSEGDAVSRLLAALRGTERIGPVPRAAVSVEGQRVYLSTELLGPVALFVSVHTDLASNGDAQLETDPWEAS